ncbi:DNA mismatch repair ATPase msh1 [Lambiella insularis]|nr:DNA mismatch repair ATPase msh1 [Lambiella insularis]
MRIATYHIRNRLLTTNCLSLLSGHSLRHGTDCTDKPLGLPATTIWQPCQVRGAKSRSTVKLQNLPQGLLEGGIPLPEPEEDAPVYPTVIQQAKMNMRKFEDCVLLTRMGGFYELYLHQAEQYGPLLNVRVATRKTVAGPVAMAGFPYFQLERFLKILVQDLNKYVAISEEFPNDAAGKVKSGGLLFDRKVTRIVTPGTLVDEKFMDSSQNNFLLSIHPDAPLIEHSHQINQLKDNISLVNLDGQKVGLAWLDLSTGEFFTQASSLRLLASAVARIGSREIVLNNALDGSTKHDVLTLLGHQHHLVTWQPTAPPDMCITDWEPMLERNITEAEQREFSEEEVSAANMLLTYVKDRLRGLGMKLQPPLKRYEAESMGIDKSSLRGLEIVETLRDGVLGGKGTLLHAIRRTVTKSGARLLRDRITSPSTSLETIKQRLDLVQALLQAPDQREGIVSLLRRSFDSQRLAQKFSLGRGDADDLVSLLRTIRATEEIANVLHMLSSSEDQSLTGSSDTSRCLYIVLDRLSLQDPSALADRISEAIDEDGLIAIHRVERIQSSSVISMAQGVLNDEGGPEDLEAMSQIVRSKAGDKPSKSESSDEEDIWIMRCNASSTLERLHNELLALRNEKSALVVRLRSEMEVQSLTLRWTPGLGHICHVRGTKDLRVSMKTHGSARNGSTTKSTRSFYVSDWSSLGNRIDQLKTRIRAEEQRVFQELRDLVVINLVKLRRNAAVLDELDVACATAAHAIEQGLVRPVLNDGLAHKIVAGRHPTVKASLEEKGRAFVTNNCFVGEKERIWLITGPNMAGKSTFLRQNALISILAQIGWFVPAEYAEIGIVDQMFSRVGSADNLSEDQSTFMVEMLETATILKQATNRSFVIMDEVGRGTTPEDGIAEFRHLLSKLLVKFWIHFMRRLWQSLKIKDVSPQQPEYGMLPAVSDLFASAINL